MITVDGLLWVAGGALAYLAVALPLAMLLGRRLRGRP